MVRPVPGVESEPSKFTTCSTCGVCGENANNDTVGLGIVVVAIVLVDVVVSVIFTTPGPTGGAPLHPNASAASNGVRSSSFRITTWSS